MAIDFFSINRTKQPGNRAVALAQQIIEIRSSVEALIASGNHMNDGNDYSQLETLFGLAAGQGQNFFNLLGLVRAVFNTADDIPGANRKAWLDEFTARVAGQ